MKDTQLTDRFRREDRRDMVPAAFLSGAVHVILFIGLFSVFQWTTDSETVYAELWAPEAVSAGNDPQGAAEKLPDLPKPDPAETDDKRESQEAQEAREALQREAEARAEAEKAEAERAAAEQEAFMKAEQARQEAERVE